MSEPPSHTVPQEEIDYLRARVAELHEESERRRQRLEGFASLLTKREQEIAGLREQLAYTKQCYQDLIDRRGGGG